MPTKRSLTRTIYSMSPLLPFYVLGLLPGQVLWPLVFVPLILVANFVWALVLATVTVLIMGETERVGQHSLVRYAAWATVAGLMINLGHDVTLTWLGQRVDFLLEAQPWRLIGSTYVVPCALIFLYHVLLSWQYLRLRVWHAVLMGAVFAILTAPWTTMAFINFGQGRLPAASQRLLWLAVAVIALSPLLLSLSTVILRRTRRARRLGGALLLGCVAVLAAAGGANLWGKAMLTPAIGSVAASGSMGDLAFATRGRVYAVGATSTQVRSLGKVRGQVVAWSPNGRQILVQEDSSTGQQTVAVMPADVAGSARTVGSGQVAAGAWSPDSTSILYTTPTESAALIHVVRSDGSGDRVVTEGRSPSWSPDGQRIVYSGRAAGRWQVWVMLPSGDDAIQLTSDGGEDPTWSPDGRFIAYTQNNRVQIMDADGANKRRLPVDTTATDVRPLLVWSTDGTRLAYVYVYPLESGRPTQVYIWETSSPATPVGGTLLPLQPLATPTAGASKGLNRSGEYRTPFAWSSDGLWLGFVRRGDLWALNMKTGDEQRLMPAESFAWATKAQSLVVRPAPTYPPTPTPTALPAAVVESPATLLLDVREAATLYAGTALGVVRKIGNGGWFLTSTGINYPTRVAALALDPNDTKVIYAGTDGQRAIAGALYKSTDGGTRWVATGLKDVDVYVIVVDQRQAKSLYAGTSKGLYSSSDGGVTWNQRNNGLKTTVVQAMVIDYSPQGSGRGSPAPSGTVLYLGTRQGDVYKTTDGGSDWKAVQTFNAPVTSLVIDARKGVTAFATTDDGLFSSTDAGETWNQVSGGIWKVRLLGLLISPKDGTVYAYGGQGVFVSHDGGVNWGPAFTGLEGTQPSSLVAHPSDPSILYVGTDKGVYRTTNGGVTWIR